MCGPAQAIIARLALLGALGLSGVWRGATVQHARASNGQAPAPVIVPITPGEHRPVAAHSPQAYVAARISAHAPLVRVRLVVDGRRVPCEMMGRDALHQSVFYQPPHLAPGTHHVALTVWDAAGASARRTWTFRIVAAPCIRPACITQAGAGSEPASASGDQISPIASLSALRGRRLWWGQE